MAYKKRELLKIQGKWYYVVSTHNTKANAEKRLKRMDFPGRIRKSGKRWIVIQKASSSMVKRIPK